MNRFRRFATREPLLFSLVITLLLLVFYILAGVAAAVFATSNVGCNILEALGRGGGAVVFATIIFQFGWQRATGLTRLGSPGAWLVGSGILVYEGVTHICPLAADADLAGAIWPETAPVAFNALATGPLEEIAFRGLILYAFLRVWATTGAGIVKSVLASSLLFGASHLIHILLGRPLPEAILVAANASLAGIYYAAIVLRWKTLWPPIAIHSLLNALAAIVAVNTPGFEESVGALLLAVALQVPVVILGAYWIRQASPQEIDAYAP